MQTIANLGDYVARACFPKPQIDEDAEVKMNEKGHPVVYSRRWHVLAAYSLSYFMWNMSSLRQTALISEFALYFDTTNEFTAPPEWGIDFMGIADSISLIIFYPIAGKLVDTYGLRILRFASGGLAFGAWWWFLSFTNYGSVVVSRIWVSFCGAIVATSLLRIAHNWFAPNERALAVAIGALVSTLGAGAALVVSPMFSTSDQEINLNIKSCKDSFKNAFNATRDGIECSDQASDDFCCAADTNIDLLNVTMAILVSLVAIYTVVVMEDAPPTPPSKAGIVKEGPGFFKAMQLMFMHKNYTFLCIADFLCSGPPLVVFGTIDRILPGTVADLSTIGAAIALILAIPASGIFAHLLAKTKKFYEMTATGYVTGFLFFITVAIFLLIDTEILDYFVLIFGCASVICYMLWTVSVYELKMEYVFSSHYALQGYIVAVDRTVINLSSVVFVAAIPPERFNGDKIDGRQFTFLVGSLAMAIGVSFVLSIKDKTKYLRAAFEDEHGEVGELEDKLEMHPELEKKKTLEKQKSLGKQKSLEKQKTLEKQATLETAVEDKNTKESEKSQAVKAEEAKIDPEEDI